MDTIVDGIIEARNGQECIPSDENDIIIMGDFSANRFDTKKEDFWNELEADGWDVLGDNGRSYPATRLSGHPLSLRKSKIDYIIITKMVMH